MYLGADKFRAVQAVIGTYFLSDQGDAELLASNNPLLGSLRIRHGNKDKNGTDKDAIELALCYLKIMTNLFKRGFYYEKPLLLQSLHVAYGVLINYVKYQESKTDGPKIDIDQDGEHSRRNSTAKQAKELELQPLGKNSVSSIGISEELRSIISACDMTYSRVEQHIVIFENQRYNI